jgi:hypothetical protein
VPAARSHALAPFTATRNAPHLPGAVLGARAAPSLAMACRASPKARDAAARGAVGPAPPAASTTSRPALLSLDTPRHGGELAGATPVFFKASRTAPPRSGSGSDGGSRAAATWRTPSPFRVAGDAAEPPPSLLVALGGAPSEALWLDADEPDAETPSAVAMRHALAEARRANPTAARFAGASKPARLAADVFVGDAGHAADAALLSTLGVTHVVCCAPDAVVDAPPHVKHLLLPAHDTADEPLLHAHLPPLVAFLRDKPRGSVVLVHCQRGVNRSVALAAAFVALRDGERAAAVAALAAAQRPAVLTNSAFLQQLATLDEPALRSAWLARLAPL